MPLGGFKLLDSSGNLRSLRATNPYSVNINNNTDLVIGGPLVSACTGTTTPTA